MAKVVVTVALAVRSFPVGTAAGAIKVSLGPDMFLEQEQGPFVFEDVPVGTYTVTAERVGADGARLGDAVSKSFVVVATSTDIQVPVDFTITQE